MNYNRIILAGNLTKDPELRQTQSGMSICSATIAVNEKRVGKDGEKINSAVFVDFKAFGKAAENIARYFTKGKPILIEGRLSQESWEDKKSGQKRSRMIVIADWFSFVNGGDKTNSAEPQSTAATSNNTNSDEVFDDVPF